MKKFGERILFGTLYTLMAMIILGIVGLASYGAMMIDGSMQSAENETRGVDCQDWSYYEAMGKDITKEYCNGNTRLYNDGFEDGAVNAVTDVMEEMVITGNEVDGYTVIINGEQFYYSTLELRKEEVKEY